MDTVRDALLSTGIDTGRPLVAAVSGGADSMALLEALRQLSQEDVVGVVAAHFNHGLRGAESDLDEKYVADWCAARHIQCVTGRAGRVGRRSRTVPRQQDGSPEAAARSARYAFLSRVQTDLNAAAVATGHTLDDQAETVLLHLVRGSGLTGLRGMGPVTRLRIGAGLPSVTVVRPLLGLRRHDTENYCADRGILPRHDTSNDDLTVPRNRLRQQVVPLLQSISPGAIGAISRLVAASRDDLDFLSAAADVAWEHLKRAEKPGEPGRPPSLVRISRAGFKRLHPSIRRRVLMRMHVSVAADAGAGEINGLALDHIEAMLALAEGRAGTSLDLPGDTRFEIGYHRLAMTSAGTASDDADCPFPRSVAHTKLAIPGATDLGEGFLIRSHMTTVQPSGHPPRWTAHLDPSQSGQLSVRTRAPGDRFEPSGMVGDKKLQDFFVDEKVPRRWRDRVPLVVTDRGIAWVVGYRVADWAIARGGKALKLRARPLKNASPENSQSRKPTGP